MKYMGSKRRIAKEILPIILRDRKLNQWYVEPFCGGLNTCMLVNGNVLANDSHPALISLYKALQNDWTPPEIVTEDDYKNAKLLEDSNPLKGYIGFTFSFASKYFGGYSRQKKNTHGCKENEMIRSRHSYNDVLKTKCYINHVQFENGNYYDLEIPENSIIYWDPPYKNTTGYKIKFDHDRFYEWCIEQHNKGHQIFISEYDIPDDRFIPIWEKIVKTNMGNVNADTGFQKIEKFVYR